MDGGSSLNILYTDTLDAMGIDRARLRPSGAPFHGVMPGKQAIPLGQIDLPAKFGDPSNYRKETLMFEVVGFKGAYHAILGWLCYCEVESCELASVVIASEDLAVIKEETPEEAPDSKWAAGSFEPAEGVKEVLINPQASGDKKVRVGVKLTPK
ncbi:uncharacterized protein LOC120639948 [Panicum virgatum]|uniref:uncharacterized protein LOC120639948 n=1 Tax=Panicum virgatum TaxID=38727 RepID=UPI0019D56698|nr:uncharacterized protein LOC120639948 [Panicum virgatum]